MSINREFVFGKKNRRNMLGQAAGAENNTGNNPVKGMGIRVIQIPSESCKLIRACRMERNYNSGKLPDPTGQGRSERRRKGQADLAPQDPVNGRGTPGWTQQ